MKMKSVLGFLTVVVTVFAFVLTASAQSAEINAGPADCYNCAKCSPGKVPCPGSSTQTGPQGTTTTTTDAASPFDYDGTPVGGTFGPWGYCNGYNIAEQSDRNCKMILDICNCDTPFPCDLTPGEKIGVRMTILTNGVYWADPSHETVYFDLFRNENAPCPATALGEPTVTEMNSVPVYNDGAGSGEEGQNDITGQEVRNFGPIGYYRDTSCTVPGTPLPGDYTGTIPSANQVVALQSYFETDYTITVDDATLCKFWIDIPPMRLDGTAQPGAPIEVEIRILSERNPESLCPGCEPVRYCGCTRQVGIVCCDSQEVITGTGCMFFPYVLQGLIDDSGWSTGVAISCREDAGMPADAWVKLTLKDRGGNTSTYTRTNMGSGLVWAFVLDDIMGEFDTALVPGATSLEVTSNYSMDGYQFLNVAGTFGAGSNARGCDGKCCP